MKAVIQRVVQAAAHVDGVIVGEIGKGLCVLVGISKEDGPDDLEYIARKLLNLRLWESETGKSWDRSVKDINGGILLLSQFTLMHVLKGNKPDFHNALNPTDALKMFEELRDKLRKEYSEERVATGKFQAYSNIHIVNDGPVTIQLDSRNKTSV